LIIDLGVSITTTGVHMTTLIARGYSQMEKET
jgi:hypothetical protein